ncbi:Kiwa anti-phage protein KwaB-like domain-containing protein [Polaribacter vadi]|uniref:Kiwa anti-phage protein KwaB-like domain-containing protein n=1 Tax=Polaribacter vadi TaxID=1774273 RepID=UPI0030EC8E29|tara:strand:+ start:22919 stop:23854 length:936 start_codon:yes stop_codon:yes gene_type:complete
MNNQQKFNELKRLNLNESFVSLAIVKEYKRDRISHYNIEYVEIEEELEERLRNIIVSRVDKAGSFEEYSFDCPEPEEDLVRTIPYESTDFYKIMESLLALNPEEDKVDSVEDLVKAKSYIIVLRDNIGIQLAGFKAIPENWKLKKSKGLIPLLFENNTFKDLETDNVFSISSTVDFLYYKELLFILSKKAFEQGMNFRDGMIAKANALYEETEELNLFVNIEILKRRVGNNQRYLRKIATIKNLGYYKDQNYLMKFKTINEVKNWGIEFNEGQIVITDETLDDVLTVLQNKRLHSELSEEDFDVESVKKLD